MTIENRELPIFILGIDHYPYNDNFTVDKVKDIEVVKKFYTDIGIEICKVEHICPSIGPERDEIIARYPDGWREEGVGGPWVYVFDADGNKQFSMFVKKAPWDYCFFAKPVR